MAQTEVLEFLKKNNRFYTTREIAQTLNMNKVTVQANLLRLRNWKFVDYIFIKEGNHSIFKYKAK